MSTPSIEVKKSNIILHFVEAEFYDRIHLEIFNEYEKRRIARNLSLIDQLIDNPSLCIDIGAGTGNLTRFELRHYNKVVATDISVNMLKKIRRNDNLNTVRCDAEHLPFREEVATLISMFSVLHHLYDPSSAIREMLRCLRKGGVLYIDHEPCHLRLRRFSDLMNMLVSGLCIFGASFIGIRCLEETPQFPILNYSKAEMHASGFYVKDLSSTLKSKGMKIILAKSYYWLTPLFLIGHQDFWRLSYRVRRLLTICLIKANFLIEKLPFSGKLGRAICVIAKKVEKGKS